MTKTLELIEDVGEFFGRTGRRFAIIYESTLPGVKHGEMRVAFSHSSDKEFLESSVHVLQKSVSMAMDQIEERGGLEEGMHGTVDEEDIEDLDPDDEGPPLLPPPSEDNED